MEHSIDAILLDGTIENAAAGDEQAIYSLLKHYDSYINSLCIRPVELPDGKKVLRVNEDIKAEVRIHLIQKILQFDCGRYL